MRKSRRSSKGSTREDIFMMSSFWATWELAILVCAVYLTWGLTDSIQVKSYVLKQEKLRS